MFIISVTKTALKNCKSQEFANKSNFYWMAAPAARHDDGGKCFNIYECLRQLIGQQFYCQKESIHQVMASKATPSSEKLLLFTNSCE